MIIKERVFRLVLRHCWAEVRLHEDGKITAHYKTLDGKMYENFLDASNTSLHRIATRCFVPGDDRIASFVQTLWEGAKELETSFDKRSHGSYVGPEEQFQGRQANLVVYDTHVMAQFDTGELWETHSRLNFPIEHWEIDEAA